jgi:hypothetical protein
MTYTTADNSKMPLGYRLAWRLLGWGFEREDGFWIADAYLQDVPYHAERHIWWKDGTLNVWLRSKLEVSIEPRHVARMVRLVKVATLIAVAFAGGWWLKG